MLILDLFFRNVWRWLRIAEICCVECNFKNKIIVVFDCDLYFVWYLWNVPIGSPTATGHFLPSLYLEYSFLCLVYVCCPVEGGTHISETPVAVYKTTGCYNLRDRNCIIIAIKIYNFALFIFASYNNWFNVASASGRSSVRCWPEILKDFSLSLILFGRVDRV
jgi:hypothetical protein